MARHACERNTVPSDPIEYAALIIDMLIASKEIKLHGVDYNVNSSSHLTMLQYALSNFAVEDTAASMLFPRGSDAWKPLLTLTMKGEPARPFKQFIFTSACDRRFYYVSAPKRIQEGAFFCQAIDPSEHSVVKCVSSLAALVAGLPERSATYILGADFIKELRVRLSNDCELAKPWLSGGDGPFCFNTMTSILPGESLDEVIRVENTRMKLKYSIDDITDGHGKFNTDLVFEKAVELTHG
jgi:hypothetical protein